MTYAQLKNTILEGAPSEAEAKEADAAMAHYSYTSLSYRITHLLSESDLTAEQQDDLVVSFSLNFYLSEMARYRETGTFQKIYEK